MDMPDISKPLTEEQPMTASVEGVFADNTNANGDQFIGTAINNSDNNSVLSAMVAAHTPRFTVTLSVISSERQAFILMKVLYRRHLTDKEKFALPSVLNLVGRDIIGAGPAAVLLKHIENSEMLFKDEALLEQCIEQLTKKSEGEPVTTLTTNHDISDYADDSLWVGPRSDDSFVVIDPNEVFAESEDRSFVEIEGTADNHGIEKLETSGTIGEQ